MFKVPITLTNTLSANQLISHPISVNVAAYESATILGQIKLRSTVTVWLHDYNLTGDTQALNPATCRTDLYL